MRERESITAENISGLVVGEGCFYAESRADPKYRLGWRLRPAFCIEMREDDKDVLEEVRNRLGCGQVYDLDFGRYREYGKRGWKPHAKYRVTRLKDLNQKVVPFFRTYPLFGRKQRAFELFEELVGLLCRGTHRTPAGLKLARSVAQRLSEHNGRG